MSPDAVWVIGAGGLLGSALVRAFEHAGCQALHRVRDRLAWGQDDVLTAQLEREVAAFAELVRDAERWVLVWAAGVGSMSSDPVQLNHESRALDVLLGRLAAEPVLCATPGCLVLASSAGAVYGRSSDECITEASAIAPGTPYAMHKLQQEEAFHGAVRSQAGWSALIARYSTLYGPGQSRHKAQGIISQMARRIVANDVVHIYVPLDTIRDYMFVDDAAERTLDVIRDVRDRAGEVVIKIIAAEQATSIAQLVGIFRRVSRRQVRLVTSVTGLSPLYARCIRFRSAEPAGQPHTACRSLHIGIHQVLEAERTAAFRSSQRHA